MDGLQDPPFPLCLSVKSGTSAKEKFGVAEIEAESVVDQANRLVALPPKMRILLFPKTTDFETKSLQRTVEELYPQEAGL